MSPKRARCPGASLAALVALGLTGSAHAASYTVKPQVSVEQSFDDNVFAAENEAGQRPSRVISSWVTRLVPLVVVERKAEESDARVQLGATRRNTWSVSELDGTDEHVDLWGRRALSRRLSVSAHGRYDFYEAYNTVESTVPGGDPLVLFAERPDLRVRNLDGDLKYMVDDVTEATLDFGWRQLEYDEAERTGLFDEENRSVSLSLNRRISTADTLGVQLAFNRSEEENAETRASRFRSQSENELGTAMAFWQRQWSPRWSTALHAGARTLDSESEVQLEGIHTEPFCPPGVLVCIDPILKGSDSGSGFIGGGSTSYAYSHRGGVTLSYSRDTRTGTSTSTGSSSIDVDSFSARISHKLSRRLTLSLGGTYMVWETTNEAPQQELTIVDSGAKSRQRTADLRLDWQLRKDLFAYGSFTYFDLDQERPLSILNPKRDYERRIFTIGVRYAFEQEL